MPEFKPFSLADSMQTAQAGALNNFRLNEAARSVQAREGLSQAVQAGTPEAMQQYRGQFPTEAREWDASEIDYRNKKLQSVLAESSMIEFLARGVTDDDSYQRAIARAKELGLPGVENAPPNYIQGGKQFTEQALMQSLSLKDRLTLQEKDKGALVEIYDPKSPTGTRMVTREEAAGKPGKPESGWSIDTDKDGNVRIVKGRGAGTAGGLEKRTASEVEDKIIKAGDTMAQLKSIERLYRPEFQQLGTRFGTLATKWKSKADLKISPQERQTLKEFSKFKAEAGQLFALTLKDLSGVAVNPTEFKRAEGWLPNPGTGLFDGDSPIEMEAKRERFEEFTRKALIKYNYIRKNGLSINDIDVDDMPKIVQKRGNELEFMYKSQGLQGDELNRAVKIGLSDEFGFGTIQ